MIHSADVIPEMKPVTYTISIIDLKWGQLRYKAQVPVYGPATPKVVQEAFDQMIAHYKLDSTKFQLLSFSRKGVTSNAKSQYAA